jgi:GT2 family glycosyltransferase
LEQIAICFADTPALGYLGGRVLLHDPADLPVTINESQEQVVFAAGEFLPAGIIQGANFACRRPALECIGGFDERLGVGAWFNCEEIDALARMSAAGWPGHFDPRPIVRHHHGRTNRDDGARLLRGYDRGRGAYYMKCLLNSRLRGAYVRAWAMEMRRRDWRTTGRELAAAAEFVWRHATGRW